jgi:hypothetical protein
MVIRSDEDEEPGVRGSVPGGQAGIFPTHL